MRDVRVVQSDSTAVADVTPLGTTEAYVLKWACERAIERDERVVHGESLFGDLALGQMSAEVLLEALEVLVAGGYLMPAGSGYFITSRGMGRYARAHFANYAELVRRVARCLVEVKLRSSDAIAEGVGARHRIVVQVLTEFAALGYVRAVEGSSGSVRVSVSSPELRKMMRKR